MLKNYAHEREATASSNDSLQLRPFSKWELLFKDRICPQREGILSFMSSSLYTQKKKFSQYLCFLIKSTILHISLSNFIHEFYYRSLTCTCYCLTNNAFIRLYQPNFKCTMCTCCDKPAGFFLIYCLILKESCSNCNNPEKIQC